MAELEVSPIYGVRVVGLYEMGGIGKSTLCKALCNELLLEFSGKVCYIELSNTYDDKNEEELLREVLRRLIGTPNDIWTNYNKTKLKALKRKSLIENLGDGSSAIGMHDLWREFFVMETRIDDNFRGQNWLYRVNEIQEGLTESNFYNGGWKKLQRICLTFPNPITGKSGDIHVKRVNLRYCSNLAVLKLVEVDVKERVVDLSPLSQLKSLEVLSNCVRTPIELQGLGVLTDLCVLIWSNIPSSSPCVDEIARLSNLQVLELSSDEGGMIKFPDLNGLPSLRSVELRMSNVANSLVGLGSRTMNLRYLDLRDCKGMRSCQGLGDLVALMELDLSGCGGLEMLPSLGKLQHLHKLDISRGSDRISTVPGLEYLVALQVFKASGCTKLAKLAYMRMLSNLQVLDLDGCPVEPFPGLDQLTALQELDVRFDALKPWPALPQLAKMMQKVENAGWSARGLPCMAAWTSLESLTISNGRGVHTLEGLERLSRLQELNLEMCDFRDASIVSSFTGLQRLTFRGSYEVEKQPNPDPLLNLKSLVMFSTTGEGDSTRSTSRGALEECDPATLPQLHSLYLDSLPICDLPDLSKFPQLRRLHLQGCHAITRVTSTVPSTTLQRLYIADCSSLESLPDFRGSTELRTCYVTGCHSLKSAPDFSGSKFPFMVPS